MSEIDIYVMKETIREMHEKIQQIELRLKILEDLLDDILTDQEEKATIL